MNVKTTFAACGVLGLAIAQGAGAAEMPTLRYAVGSEDLRSLSQLPTEVARRKGFFERESVRVEFVQNSESNSPSRRAGPPT